MILGALTAYYERLLARNDSAVPVYAYSAEKISFCLVLSKHGEVRGVDDLRDLGGKTPLPRLLTVPQSFKRPGTVPKPFFLWDKTAFVFGVEGDKADSARMVRAPRQHNAFRAMHESALGETDDEGLQALLRFLEGWNPDCFGAAPFGDEMLDANFVFRLEGERNFLHERPAARDVWLKLSTSSGNRGICLVTGSEAPIARLHPAIKGVAGAQTSGASIVSFNLDAFKSYGKAQGENAPVSEHATFAYTTALNHLLRRGENNRQRLQIGDATVVFWAQAKEAPAAEAAEGLFAALMAPPSDEQEGARLRHLLEDVRRGRPLALLDPQFEKGTRFFVLGLAPNASRLSIRFWLVDELDVFARHLADHYADLMLEPSPWRTPPSIWRLLLQTAVQGDAENIPPQLAGEVARSVLTGARYPRSLLANVIMRIRAEAPAANNQDARERDRTFALRAALCKACLARDFRTGVKGVDKEIPMSLDRQETNPGYRLGRLFAALEDAQRAALGGQLNATIRERYYGAASATPASVFPMLLRTATHHFAKLRKDGKGGLAHVLQQELGEILEGFGTTFPRNLRIEDQGRFAIGYFHQSRSRWSRAADSEDDSEPDSPVDQGD